MTQGHDHRWLVKRTDLETPQYMGAWQHSFIWTFDPQFALHFLTEEHAKTMADLMSVPCEPAPSSEISDDLPDKEPKTT